ncbi:protein CTR9 [Sesamum angolense]|uniref:Protein CTR9 n=1 Tax=Sesamum angolense TaxID=2727404 RepID=A0AAE1WEF0_9LAMI|nr:protein CTR9 [Sesamum angolense]
MLGDLELKNDDWVKAKETFRAAKDSTDEKDSYAAVCLVLLQQSANLYAANGAGMVFAERGQFDIAKDLFTQVQEAASGSSDVQMPDVWINLAHVHFAQGNFALAVKMVRATVAELKNAVRLFSLLSAASNLQFHGFDEKKIETHVAYCKHLLEAATVHCDLAEREEKQNMQRLEVMRQMELADESRRKAEEQRKYQMEKRKQEDELKQVMQQEKHLERIKEQWKSSSSASKRKDKPQTEDEEGGASEKRRRKGGKRRKKDKRSRYESEEAEAEAEADDQEEMEYDDANMGYREQYNDANDNEDKDGDIPQDVLAATGLEDSDAEDNAAAPTNTNRRRRAWSESDEDEEPLQRQSEADHVTDMQVSDREANGASAGAGDDEE